MISLKKFKGILPAATIEKYPDYDIKLCSTVSKKTHQVIKTTKSINIYINNLSPKQLKFLKEDILINFEAGNLFLLEDSRVDLLNRLYQYNDDDDNRILDFFKSILSRMDWEALRDSLFLRYEFKKHRSISTLKTDIIARFSERGNTISNLCTAGYFEEVMINLYNSSKEEFWKYYDLALDKGITALFVNSKMDTKKIQEEIQHRLKSAKTYGLPYVHIHGIGNKNIKNIEECISKQKGSLPFTNKNIFKDDKLHVLIVELIL